MKECKKKTDLREKAILDEKAIYRLGIKDGLNERNIEIVKKMLEENTEIDFIARITGLTKEEIEKIKKSIEK